MSLHTWLLFAGTEAVLCLTPGPAVLFVLSYGLSRGGRASLWASAGVLAGNACYFALSALGLGAVLLASYEVFTLVKYLGALYLVYLGVQTVRGAALALRPERAQEDRGSLRALTRGFALQAANPKALVFFVALLPQFIDASRAVWPQVLILGVTSVAIEFVVLAGYGCTAARAAALTRQVRFRKLTNRVCGGMLVVAGTGVALAGER